MTWLWYHNAGQTMTYLKNSQKTGQLLSQSDPLSVHVVFFFPSLIYFFTQTLHLFLNCSFPLVYFTRNCYSSFLSHYGSHMVVWMSLFLGFLLICILIRYNRFQTVCLGGAFDSFCFSLCVSCLCLS